MISPDHPRAPFDAKVTHHLQQGEFGRAREILRNRLEQQAFDPDALEQLGWVLLQMRDQVEAGRYLFLSGNDQPAYQPPIRAFLARTRGMDLHAFSSLWPAPLRRTRVTDLPRVVREELLARGMDAAQLEDTLDEVRRRAQRNPRSPWAGMLLLVLLTLAVLLTYWILRSRN